MPELAPFYPMLNVEMWVGMDGLMNEIQDTIAEASTDQSSRSCSAPNSESGTTVRAPKSPRDESLVNDTIGSVTGAAVPMCLDFVTTASIASNTKQLSFLCSAERRQSDPRANHPTYSCIIPIQKHALHRDDFLVNDLKYFDVRKSFDAAAKNVPVVSPTSRHFFAGFDDDANAVAECIDDAAVAVTSAAIVPTGAVASGIVDATNAVATFNSGNSDNIITYSSPAVVAAANAAAAATNAAVTAAIATNADANAIDTTRSRIDVGAASALGVPISMSDLFPDPVDAVSHTLADATAAAVAEIAGTLDATIAPPVTIASCTTNVDGNASVGVNTVDVYQKSENKPPTMVSSDCPEIGIRAHQGRHNVSPHEPTAPPLITFCPQSLPFPALPASKRAELEFAAKDPLPSLPPSLQGDARYVVASATAHDAPTEEPWMYENDSSTREAYLWRKYSSGTKPCQRSYYRCRHYDFSRCAAKFILYENNITFRNQHNHEPFNTAASATTIAAAMTKKNKRHCPTDCEPKPKRKAKSKTETGSTNAGATPPVMPTSRANDSLLVKPFSMMTTPKCESFFIVREKTSGDDNNKASISITVDSETTSTDSTNTATKTSDKSGTTSAPPRTDNVGTTYCGRSGNDNERNISAIADSVTTNVTTAAVLTNTNGDVSNSDNNKNIENDRYAYHDYHDTHLQKQHALERNRSESVANYETFYGNANNNSSSNNSNTNNNNDGSANGSGNTNHHTSENHFQSATAWLDNARGSVDTSYNHNHSHSYNYDYGYNYGRGEYSQHNNTLYGGHHYLKVDADIRNALAKTTTPTTSTWGPIQAQSVLAHRIVTKTPLLPETRIFPNLLTTPVYSTIGVYPVGANCQQLFAVTNVQQRWY